MYSILKSFHRHTKKKEILMKKFYSLFILCIIICIFLIPVGTFIFANEFNDNEIYLGGTPLGVVANADGVIVTDYVEVVTQEGVICPARNAGLLLGDMIVSINDKKVLKAEDIMNIVSKDFVDSKTLKLTVLRENKTIYLDVLPSLDASLKDYKLGIIAKNNIAGVGTLTYVRKDLRFGGLGHKIYDTSMPLNEYYKTGNIFACTILGIVKSKENKAGEVKGHFERNGVNIGNIDKNNNYGIFGYIEKEDLVHHSLIALGTKNNVKMGKAFIYTTIDGNKPQMYSIEIIKNEEQKTPEQKGMVIRITDARLLEKTGGIVQGMSGSPIIQNEKLVGAVTHVFVNDPTKGYGLYIDWMINN